MNPRHKPDPDDEPYLRYYAWNFTNLDSSLKQTVEFRAPPMVTNADECRSWVEFAVNFVHAAIQTPTGPYQNMYQSNYLGLDHFLAANTMKGLSDVGSWRRVFASSIPDRRPARSNRGDFNVVEVIPSQRRHARERYTYY